MILSITSSPKEQTLTIGMKTKIIIIIIQVPKAKKKLIWVII